MPQKLDLIGQNFNRLTVIQESGRNKFGQIEWLCLCDCGNEVSVVRARLKGGHTQSCGCLLLEWVKTDKRKHGGRHTAEYHIWLDMKQRCSNPNNIGYPNYGGRGIKVCERWMNFENFISDVGKRPSPRHSLDRYPDMNGGYGPNNFRWATRDQQQNNVRKNIWIEFGGVKMTRSNWAKCLGIADSTLKNHLKTKTMDEAFIRYKISFDYASFFSASVPKM